MLGHDHDRAHVRREPQARAYEVLITCSDRDDSEGEKIGTQDGFTVWAIVRRSLFA